VCFGRQKQLFFAHIKLEADPFHEGTAHGLGSCGYAAEISFGIACYSMQPISLIFNE
jgi:hypothetical protein